MKSSIRDWEITRTGDQDITVSKPGRAPLFMAHEENMDEDVIEEYITTRILEAEMFDAGARAFDVNASGDLVLNEEAGGTTGKSTKKLQAEYCNQVLDSRLNQEMRQRRLSRARG